MTTFTVDLAPQFGVLAIDGPDAATFLQGQATCDARLVSPSRGALGALCNLQGRMIASFFVVAAPDGLRLVMPRDRVAPVLQHLKKYAVFSKVMLRDAGDERLLTGLFGAGAEAAAADLAGNVPAATHDAVTTDALTLLRLRGKHRLLAISAAPLAIAGAVAGDLAHWTQSAIAAGELLVDGANADKFLPQGLNYDVIDGVSFKKGCYTGQEVVARMHFKGKMKERLYSAVAAGGIAAAAPGAPVFRAGEAQEVGHVVSAASTGAHTHLALVVRHDAIATGVRLGAPDGAPLEIHAPAVPFPELAG
ncbi:MAG: YgfZ/GcvT domain-containing protein [Gammaproteobacteria bacterium]